MKVLVTGGRGFVGGRLVEMLSDRDYVSEILSIDIKPVIQGGCSKVKQLRVDMTELEELLKVSQGVDIVYHVGGLVGPYFPNELYYKVNVEGTKNIIEMCRRGKIKRLIFCSSPSTRFQGPYGMDINGLRESELDYPKIYTHLYSETKAMAEKLVLEADRQNELMACALGPHQVYGPGDLLFLPSFVKQAESGALRVIGDGQNYCSYTYVDNICHALILAGEQIDKRPEIRGQFFVITDGVKSNMWRTLDEALVMCGFDSIFSKWMAPTWLMLSIAYILQFVQRVLFGDRKQLSKITPFSVKMLTINRYFNIEKAEQLLGYSPLVPSKQAWEITCQKIRETRDQKSQEKQRTGKIPPAFYDTPLELIFYVSLVLYSLKLGDVNILQNPKNWGMADYLFYVGFFMLMSDILDLLLIYQYRYFESRERLIIPNQAHYEFDSRSRLYVFINRWQSIPFIYTFLYYVWNSQKIVWSVSELNLLNTIVALVSYFIFYDLMYYIFHKTLHHESIYRFIHKHHHQQFTPSRGYIDGINTHPLEYLCGSYMHIAAVILFPSNHMFTIAFFMIFSGYLASINHTRIKFSIPWFYAVEDHDTHHNDVSSNFGQYIMFWDHLLKTRMISKKSSKIN